MKSEKIISWDEVWESVFSKNPWGKYPGESLIRFIARNYYKSDRKNIKILEVGCGPGANLWYLAREHFATYGIDGSETAIHQAKNRLKEESLSAQLTVGDIIKLPYENDSFDAVIDVECIYANSEKNAGLILSEIYRVLKTGGLFYSRTLSEKMYLGKTRIQLSEKSFKDISDGALAGKGFARLMDKNDIHALYGNKFQIISIDSLDLTNNNGAESISEYVIISKK